ncbi:signal transduction histidine kinase [Sporomusaceae bacterium BoRhaA]|uniref:sensor histidine kinase n=1 Tax=Pelorhabdus rhamnosifermentans TaxID=2772457 RepID=UPI001FE250B3|nr:HAMP domain-containing sensor histidine kinase [Pelorhabdus rhamnosifermentans]MBU2699395.1 signal transduction histidine kinase [Pelorhabdus rhamnosifermentans]
MFHKLRLKLTLVNASIILMLFILLIVGAYYFLQFDMNRHADFLTRKIMSDIQSGRIKDIPQHPGKESEFPARLQEGLPEGPLPPGPPPLLGPLLGAILGPQPGLSHGQNFFFVESASSGDIIFKSSVQQLSPDRLAVLTTTTLQTAALQGTVTFDQIPYSYLKSSLNAETETFILFRDLSPEVNMQRNLLTALIIVGAICSLLSFVVSFFMANWAMIPIQKAWQQQKNFLSDASHELRTPLTIIQTNLDIVRRSPDETVSCLSKWVDNIQQECVYMAKLVDSLLFLARTDSQQQTLDKQLFIFNSALMQAVVSFETVAAEKELSLEVSEDVLIQCYGDEARIRQVIGILLDNAIRHTSVGGKILVSLVQVDTKALVTVADSGEGIESEYLEKIFDRFYQVDSSRSRGGAGLGLALAKEIIESHGGVINVSSIPGTGTTFRIWIPLLAH